MEQGAVGRAGHAALLNVSVLSMRCWVLEESSAERLLGHGGEVSQSPLVFHFWLRRKPDNSVVLGGKEHA